MVKKILVCDKCGHVIQRGQVHRRDGKRYHFTCLHPEVDLDMVARAVKERMYISKFFGFDLLLSGKHIFENYKKVKDLFENNKKEKEI